MLLDDVDREPVAAGRDRGAQREALPQRLARLDAARERRAQTVPHDRVAALVEPVVAQEQAVLVATCTPWGRTCVLDLDGCVLQCAGLHGFAFERQPACDEWASGGVHGGGWPRWGGGAGARRRGGGAARPRAARTVARVR